MQAGASVGAGGIHTTKMCRKVEQVHLTLVYSGVYTQETPSLKAISSEAERRWIGDGVSEKSDGCLGAQFVWAPGVITRTSSHSINQGSQFVWLPGANPGRMEGAD